MDDNRPLARSGQLFVLDIGTRSVVGIAGHMEGDLFWVEAAETEPHPRRAMLDGQIEDIDQVARVAALVRGRVEQKLGVRFERVSVAAAGRALKTCRATAEAQLPAGVPISEQTAYSLENAAINEARAALRAQHGEASYFCVGHSVVRSLLDGYPFTTIVGHQAQCAEVEIIATFLPAEVVESLRRCVEKLGLEVDMLTLEPIAAMRSVIPQDLRLLNLALADIGAGTSDIAISANSTISGYTMATVAGDEVTEAIIKHFLVDFKTAERLKLALATKGPFGYADILGFEHEPEMQEILDTIAPAVETLAQVIADKILECNAGPPAAVFLVGGGSKTPGLPVAIAGKLGLAENRVAVAGANFSDRVLGAGSGLDDPEYATPVGIALIAADNAKLESAAVTVNGERVRLFGPDKTSLLDALLAGGYTYSDLMGRHGRALSFTLNGQRRVVRGGPYTTAELSVNGRVASPSTPVHTGDVIEIAAAQNGKDAQACVADVVPAEQLAAATVNGAAVSGDTLLKDGDAVCFDEGIPAPEAPPVTEGERDEPMVEPLKVTRTSAQPTAVWDERPAAMDAEPAPAAHEIPPEAPVREEPPEAAGESQPVAAEQEPEEAKDAGEGKEAAQPVVPPPAGNSLRIELNGKMVVLPPKPGGERHLLLDMLTLVDIDPKHPKGKVRVRVNGAEAPYMEELVSGDRVEIGWEE